MDPRAAQERLLSDVLFTLVKNKESFAFDKLMMLFPMLTETQIKEKYHEALENRNLLEKIMKEKPNIITFDSSMAKSSVQKLPPKKLPLNYISSTEQPIVTIHVLDETNNTKSDFVCGRALLVKEMKYFHDYLPEEETALSEIDISVHCDIHIFSLLMNWVKRNESAESFKLSKSNLIPVLVSADFLQIKSLVEYAAKEASYFASEINLSVLSKELIEKIAGHMKPFEIDKLKDDDIRETMYRQLVLDEAGRARLFRCGSCKTILPWAQRTKLRCLSKNVEMDKRGNVKWKHTVDTLWEFAVGANNELSRMVNENIKLVYWRIWGLSHTFDCEICKQHFQASDIKTCHYHPKEASLGIYPCCKKSKKDFNPLMGRNGCKKKYHQVNNPILRDYFQFTGIIRDVDMESDIGPMWRENTPNDKVSLWQTGKSLRWNQDNIRDAERRQFRLDSESCSLGTITNVPPGGIYIQLEKDRAPKPIKKQNTRSILY